ncbi:MAG: hypothetical protein LBP67_05220 [Bacteroidales bacterium]|nr:hypothetical protein [Bacteroidales bacterium]
MKFSNLFSYLFLIDHILDSLLESFQWYEKARPYYESMDDDILKASSL